MVEAKIVLSLSLSLSPPPLCVCGAVMLRCLMQLSYHTLALHGVMYVRT